MITNFMSSEGGLKSGGTISGDVTISGDLTVNGNGSGNYDEIINGALDVNIAGSLNNQEYTALRLKYDDSTGASTDSGVSLDWTWQDDASSEATIGKIAVVRDNGDNYGAMKFYTANNGTNTLRMTIDDTGNVGIGVTPVGANLHIKGAASNYAVLKLESASASHGTIVEFGDPTDDDYGTITQFASSAGEGGRMRFIAGTTETMNLRGGNVIVGHTTAVDVGQTGSFQVHGTDNDGGSMNVVNWGNNSAHSAQIHLAHSKSNSKGTNTTLADNDAIGGIFFRGADGSDFETISASIVSNVDGSVATSRVPAELIFSTAAGSSDDDVAERMKIGSNGTTTITGHQIISTSADEKGVSIQNTANASSLRSLEMYIDGNGKGCIRKTSAGSADNDLFLQPAYGNVCLTGAGNFGIGTSSPDAKLHIFEDLNNAATSAPTASESYQLFINGAAGSTGDTVGIALGTTDGNDNVSASMIAIDTGSAGIADLAFYTKNASNTAERMRITSDGNVGIGNSALETWKTDMSVLQIGGDGSIAAKTTAAAGNDFFIARNAYWDSTNNRWEYMSTNGDDEAERLVMANGTYAFDLTGTAGADDAAITFTTALQLDSNSRISLSNNDGGAFNTILGSNAGGSSIDSGAGFNVIIGDNAAADGAKAAGYDNNTIIGYSAAEDGTASSNSVAIGFKAMELLTTGVNNTVVGSQAFDAAAHDESDNVVIGLGAMGAAAQGGASGDNNREIKQNIAIGSGALMGGTLTSTNHLEGNIAIGHNAMDATSDSNQIGTIAIGTSALTALTSGTGNVAVGYQCLDAEDTGDSNTAIGYMALSAQDDGDLNTAVGYEAGLSHTTGSSGWGGNTFIGAKSGKYNGAGRGNTFVGSESAQGNSGAVLTGNYNTTLGVQSGLLLQGAAHSNTFVGGYSGDVATTAVENTCLGYGADIQDATATNQIVIGNNITGTKDNAVFIGNDTSHIENDFNSDATWNHSSDRRQKTDIKDETLGLEFINDLRPVTYKHKSPSEFPKEWDAYDADDKEPMGGDKTIHGFIAQEVKEAMDNANVDTFQGWSDGIDGRQRVSFEAMVMPLIKAVQELSAKVEELEKK